MKSLEQGRVPPHNIEAEQATLGALLIDNDALPVVLQFLRAGDFYKKSHQQIFSAILSLSNRNEAIDLITLTEELRGEGTLQDAGGSRYISSLTSIVPTSANVEYYAKIVHGCSVRRTLLKISAEIVASAYDESQESRAVIEDAEKLIFEITERQKQRGFQPASEIVDDTMAILDRMRNRKGSDQNFYTGVPCGLPDLDSMTSGFQESEFIVLGARPSVGKTALALTFVNHIAVKKRIPVGFFTLEMSGPALIQRLVSQVGKINAGKLRSGLLSESDMSLLQDGFSKLYEAPLYIDDTPNMKLLDLRAQARRMKSKHDIQVIFIDYIGLIEPENKGNIPRHEQVAEISRSIKSLARELNIPIVCLSQVGRQTEGKPPTLADLRESGSIEQDADVVMFLHRDRDPEKNSFTELIIAKQRNGPVGSLNLAFRPQFTLFEPASKDHA